MSKRNSLVLPPRTEIRIKLVPPDGGWGWMVLLGTALSNVSIKKIENDINFILTQYVNVRGFTS